MTRVNLAAQAALTQAHLKSILRYDPDTGEFINLVTRGKNPPGSIAGCPSRTGEYWQLQINGFRYMAHRLAVLYVKGRWPEDQVDHRDLNKRHNAWVNLREATDAEQRQNMPLRSDSRSGYTGVSWRDRDRKWLARIVVAGQHYDLGKFIDVEDAAAAYAAAKARFHPFHPAVPVTS